MKFIHTADIHLDSPLRGLSAYPNAPFERLRLATRHAFERLIDVALEEKVDFMVIAGDLYDGNWDQFNTGLFFVRQMGRLKAANIPVYVVLGNHDAQSRMTRSLHLPDNVKVFDSKKAQTFLLDDLQVALHGHSFKVAATVENLAVNYPAVKESWFNIGVLHTALEGESRHARYAPCSIAELEAKGYQYWALGHVHEQWIRRGQTTIAYPGNLQGRHIGEAGARTALLVTVQENVIKEIAQLEVDVLRWHELNVDITSAQTYADALTLLGEELDRLLADAPPDRSLAVRVVFIGQSSVHGALVSNLNQLRQEVLAQALQRDADRLWIEKVVLESQPVPRRTVDDGLSLKSALADLEALAKLATEDTEFLAALGADWAALLTTIPSEVLDSNPDLSALKQDSSNGLSAQIIAAIPLVMASVERA